MSDNLPKSMTVEMLDAALAALGLTDVDVQKVTIGVDTIEVVYMPPPPTELFTASATWISPYLKPCKS